MDRMKEFFRDHFEKIIFGFICGLFVFYLVMVSRSTVVSSRLDEVESLAARARMKVSAAKPDPRFDPSTLPAYDERILSAFKRKKDKAPSFPSWIWDYRRSILLAPLKLSLVKGQRFEQTVEITPAEAVSIEISDESIAKVRLVDAGKFILSREPGMGEGAAVVTIKLKDGAKLIRVVEVSLKEEYMPQPPTDVKAVALPGRNFVMWKTHPDDMDKVVGFNVFRKEKKDADFDLSNPLNVQPVKPVASLPDASDLETISPANLSERLNAGKAAGMFIDTSIVPNKTYWYAVQTLAVKKSATGTQGKEVLRSELSDPVAVTAVDVMLIRFVSLLGGIDTPEAKSHAVAEIEVKRYVRVRWIAHSFLVKLNGRVGGKVWAKVPEVDPSTGEMRDVEKMIDFQTDYVLSDIKKVNLWEPYKETIIKGAKDGRLVEEEVTRYRRVTGYAVVLKDSKGRERELLMERYKNLLKEKPVAAPAGANVRPAGR